MDDQSEARETQKPDLGRRTFLKRAAIGAGALGAVALVPLAKASDDGSPELALTAEEMAAAGPVLVYVRHAERGEAVLLVDGAERVVTDRALVAHLLRAKRDHLA